MCSVNGDTIQYITMHNGFQCMLTGVGFQACQQLLNQLLTADQTAALVDTATITAEHRQCLKVPDAREGSQVA